MKKITLTLLVSIMALTLVTAGIGIGGFDKTRDLSKIYRDELLTKTDAGEINPAIDIKKIGDSCKWSASQVGIINSFDNPFNCSSMTDEEIKDYVADTVLSRLENFANASIQRETYTDWGTGNLEITEEK